MFSALNQGSPIHVLERNNGLTYKVGELIGVTQPNPYNPTINNSFITPGAPVVLKVKLDGVVRDFPDVPSSNTVMSYNNGNIVISETAQGIQNEIEAIHKRNKQTLSSIPAIEKEVEACETIMKELSPTFAQDKARDERINSLDQKVSSMEGKLDKILNAINNRG